MAISDRGRNALKLNPPNIDNKFLLQFSEFRDFFLRSRSNPSVSDTESDSISSSEIMSVVADAATPDDRIEQSINEIQAALREDLLKHILEKSPAFFENLVVDLLVKMGYGGSREDAADKLGRSGDGSVDGVIREDRLGLDRIYLQAKRYQPGNKVGRPAIQEFAGALHGQGAQKGVFITTSEFTAEARGFVANNLGALRIILIDGETLTQLLTQYDVGVRVHRTFSVKRIDLDYFDENDN